MHLSAYDCLRHEEYINLHTRKVHSIPVDIPTTTQQTTKRTICGSQIRRAIAPAVQLFFSFPSIWIKPSISCYMSLYSNYTLGSITFFFNLPDKKIT